MKNFDELFNEYFDDEYMKKIFEIMEGDESSSIKIDVDYDADINDLMEKFQNMINTFEDGVPDRNSLGEPTSTNITVSDGLIFEEEIWETPLGDIVKISVKGTIDGGDSIKELLNEFGDSVNNLEKLVPLSLEEQLEDALEGEDYEECARLQKIIKKNK